MNSTTLLLAAILFFFSSASRCELVAQAEQSNEKDCEFLDFTKQFDAQGSMVSANFDVGQLEAGSTYEISLNLTSPLAKPITFGKIVSSCGCASVSTSSMSVASDKPTRFLVKINVPESSHTNSVSAGFNIYSNSDETELIGIVAINGQLNSNLRIDQSRSLFEISNQIETCQLAFVCTKPINARNLKLELSESFRDIVAKVVSSDEGHHFIELLVDKDSDEGAGVSGWIKLSDEVTGKSSKAELLFKAAPSVTISPKILRFREVESDGDAPKKMKANVLIRVEDSFFEKGDKVNQSVIQPAPNIESRMNGATLVQDVKRLGESNVYRATIWLPVADEEEKSNSDKKGPQKITWSIRSGDKSVTLDSVVNH